MEQAIADLLAEQEITGMLSRTDGGERHSGIARLDGAGMTLLRGFEE